MEGKIYGAIARVMQDVGIVGKNDSNDYDKYKYRGIDAVMNALNPAMVKNKVFVAPTVLDAQREERAGKNGTTMMYTVLTVKYTFYTEDGSSVDCVVIGEAMDRSDKSTNKAMSAAFKYACFQTFCIPTEEMHDTEEESIPIGQKKANKQAPKGDPMLAKIDAEQKEQILAEMKRTGVELSVILTPYGIKSLDEMTVAGFKATMHKFSLTKDKA
jgi:hypothetical protein